MTDNTLTIAGNLTADPELRFHPVRCGRRNFTVANTQCKFDKNPNEWVGSDTVFLNCSVWRQAAENAAKSFATGTRVVVTGGSSSAAMRRRRERRTPRPSSRLTRWRCR